MTRQPENTSKAGKNRAVKKILDQNACDFSASGNEHIDGLVQERLHTMGPTSVLFYRKPLEFTHGDGAWLFDGDGNRFLDVYNNVAVLGHAHPAVQLAVSEQLKKLNTHSRYLNKASHDYAQQLLSTVPDTRSDYLNDPRLLMTCTGSEANDVALRLAFLASGAQGVIVSEAAYHGNTYLVNQVSPSSCKKVPDWVATFSLDALQQEDLTPEQAQAAITLEINRAINTLSNHGYGVAALLVDSIFSSDGVYSHPPGFLTTAVDIVREAGGLFIADEVQPGFARTGEQFWGYLRHSTEQKPLVPDIITFGKPMGNGYPVAGLITGNALLQTFADEEGYFNTFAGTHAAIAAAQVVLSAIQTEHLQDNARETGALFKRELNALMDEFTCIKAVRGAGLFLGVDLVNAAGNADAQLTSQVINAMRDLGILIGAAGKSGSTLKIRPPLCFSAENVALFIGRLRTVLTSLNND